MTGTASISDARYRTRRLQTPVQEGDDWNGRCEWSPKGPGDWRPESSRVNTGTRSKNSAEDKTGELPTWVRQGKTGTSYRETIHNAARRLSILVQEEETGTRALRPGVGRQPANTSPVHLRGMRFRGARRSDSGAAHRRA